MTQAHSKNSYLGSSGMFSASGIFDKADIEQLGLLEGKIATQTTITSVRKPHCANSAPLPTFARALPVCHDARPN